MKINFSWRCPNCDHLHWCYTEMDDFTESKPIVLHCDQAREKGCPILLAQVELTTTVQLYTMTPVEPEYAATLAETKATYRTERKQLGPDEDLPI